MHSVLHFQDPLAAPRYRNKAHGVEVRIRDPATMHGKHGFAFSKVSPARSIPRIKMLKLHISADTDPRRNATPEHEYFHLIQNGMTHFGNKWYKEGMARWSQDAIQRWKHSDTATNAHIPPDQLFQDSYDTANTFWHPLGAACDGQTRIPEWLREKYRYVDGSPVFKDNLINGPHAMRSVLNCLHDKEPEAIKRFGGDARAWRKNGRRSDSNNDVILECARKVREQCEK